MFYCIRAIVNSIILFHKITLNTVVHRSTFVLLPVNMETHRNKNSYYLRGSHDYLLIHPISIQFKKQLRDWNHDITDAKSPDLEGSSAGDGSTREREGIVVAEGRPTLAPDTEQVDRGESDPIALVLLSNCLILPHGMFFPCLQMPLILSFMNGTSAIKIRFFTNSERGFHRAICFSFPFGCNTLMQKVKSVALLKIKSD